jgi:hypothetical protein
MYMESMGKVLRTIDPGFDGAFTLQIGPTQEATQVFLWDGLHWTASMLLQRLFWIGITLAIAKLASLLFHRFDPAQESRKIKRRRRP